MSTIRIAVVSDLHVGNAARAPDLRNDAPADPPRDVDRKLFLAAFREFVATHDIKADFLAVPGDITNHATPAEFDTAKHVIATVATALSVPLDKVIFIPGNHDSDWSVLGGASAPHAMRLAQRYMPFTSFGKHFSIDPTPLTEAPYFYARRWPTLYAIGYNSAWHDQPNSPESHHGRVDSDHMNAIANFLRNNPPPDTAVRAFLVHHHPFQYMDFLADWDDFSIMQNAEALHDLLSEFKFDLLIHGHKHYPNFNVQTLNAGHPVAILGAGTFCRLLDTRWNGLVANQFHLVETEGRDSTTGATCGRVRSWAYLASSGWAESYHTAETQRIRRRGTGIQHEKMFGFYCSPAELLNLIRVVIANALGGKSLLKISELFSAEPRLRFAPAEALDNALREFTASSKYELVSSDSDRYLVAAKA